MAYKCSTCGETIPALYAREYRKYPPVVVNAIGFRQHGKTVYFSSLFYALKKLKLANHWPAFFTMSLNEDSLDTVYENVKMLENGKLPNATPKNFPQPTMIRTQGIPFYANNTLLCYDTGGECFEKPNQLVQFAGFVRRAKATLFLISISNLDDVNTEAHRLLNTYVVGMSELGANTRNQHLVVVYTKADALVSDLWQDLVTYLTDGTVEKLAYYDNYIDQMGNISRQLRDFTHNKLEAFEFLNAADANFKTVNFSIISSLGAAPQEERLSVQIVPRRVLDPLFWMIQKSHSKWKHWWQRATAHCCRA